jgi:hypothetical protein
VHLVSRHARGSQAQPLCPSSSSQVTFIETLHALSGRVAGTELPELEEDALVERFSKRLPSGGEEFPKYTAAHFHAALYVQVVAVTLLLVGACAQLRLLRRCCACLVPCWFRLLGRVRVSVLSLVLPSWLWEPRVVEVA